MRRELLSAFFFAIVFAESQTTLLLLLLLSKLKSRKHYTPHYIKEVMRHLKRLHVHTNQCKRSWIHFDVVKRPNDPLRTSSQIKLCNVTRNVHFQKNTNADVSSVENKTTHPDASSSSSINTADVSKNHQATSPIQSNQQSNQQIPSKMKKNTHWNEIFRTFYGFIWPKGSSPEARGTKLRLTFAMSCLIASKLFNVVVPYLFKATIDSFTIPQTFAAGLLIGPASLVLACIL